MKRNAVPSKIIFIQRGEIDYEEIISSNYDALTYVVSCGL